MKILPHSLITPGTVPTAPADEDTADEIPMDSPSIGAGLDDDDDLADPVDFSSNDVNSEVTADSGNIDELGDLDLGDLLDDTDATPADEPFNIPDFGDSEEAPLDQPDTLPNMDDRLMPQLRTLLILITLEIIQYRILLTKSQLLKLMKQQKRVLKAKK